MIDVGKGYRQLEPEKDFFKHGDEEGRILSGGFVSHWHGIPALDIGSRILRDSRMAYRRPIYQEKTEDAE